MALSASHGLHGVRAGLHTLYFACIRCATTRTPPHPLCPMDPVFLQAGDGRLTTSNSYFSYSATWCHPTITALSLARRRPEPAHLHSALSLFPRHCQVFVGMEGRRGGVCTLILVIPSSSECSRLKTWRANLGRYTE